MKRKAARWLGMFAAGAVLLTGCGAGTQSSAASEADTQSAQTQAEEAAVESSSEAESAEPEEAAEAASSGEESADTVLDYDGTTIRVGSLKGPTTMGLVNLMKDSDNGSAEGTYSFTMASDPSEIVASVASGDLDIAMIPANLASTLYNKTNGGVSVIDINTLGVLYVITGDESVQSMEDLAGKTVLSTGQGATPEYAMNYLLEQSGVTDCTLEFHSEATEIAALLKEDSSKIAVLPQPFATAALLQNDALRSVFSLSDVWDQVVGESGSRFLTGATIVRNDFLAEHPGAVSVFLKEHEASADTANTDIEGTAELVAEYGIVEKAAVAAKALPNCNIVCITGEDMKAALSGYLQVLYDADPTSVGGNLPGDDFYYIAD